jgi:hypothetical protein
MAGETRHDESAWRPRVKIVFLAFAVIGAFFLIAEHRAHVLPWLPWLFLAACPLMHVFMHHGDGGHDHRGGSGGVDGRPDASPTPGSIEPDSTSKHEHGGRS